MAVQVALLMPNLAWLLSFEVLLSSTRSPQRGQEYMEDSHLLIPEVTSLLPAVSQNLPHSPAWLPGAGKCGEPPGYLTDNGYFCIAGLGQLLEPTVTGQ